MSAENPLANNPYITTGRPTITETPLTPHFTKITVENDPSAQRIGSIEYEVPEIQDQNGADAQTKQPVELIKKLIPPSYVVHRPTQRVVYDSGNSHFYDQSRNAALEQAYKERAAREDEIAVHTTPDTTPAETQKYTLKDLSPHETRMLRALMKYLGKKSGEVFGTLLDARDEKAALNMTDDDAEAHKPDVFDTQFIVSCWPYATDHVYQKTKAIRVRKGETGTVPRPDLNSVVGPQSQDLITRIYGREVDSFQNKILPDQNSSFNPQTYIATAPAPDGDPQCPGELSVSQEPAIQQIYAFLQLAPKDQFAHPFIKAMWQHAAHADTDSLVIAFLKHYGLTDRTCSCVSGKSKRQVKKSNDQFIEELGLQGVKNPWGAIQRMFDTVFNFGDDPAADGTNADTMTRHAFSSARHANTPVTKTLLELAKISIQTDEKPKDLLELDIEKRMIPKIDQKHNVRIVLAEFNAQIAEEFADEPLIANLLTIPVLTSGKVEPVICRTPVTDILPDGSAQQIIDIYRGLLLSMNERIQKANEIKKPVMFTFEQGKVNEVIYKLATSTVIRGLRSRNQPGSDAYRDKWQELISRHPNPQDLAVLGILSGSRPFNKYQIEYLTGMTDTETRNVCKRLSNTVLGSSSIHMEKLHYWAAATLRLLK